MRPGLCEDAAAGPILAGGPAQPRCRPGGADGDPGFPGGGPHRPGCEPILLADQNRPAGTAADRRGWPRWSRRNPDRRQARLVRAAGAIALPPGRRFEDTDWERIAWRTSSGEVSQSPWSSQPGRRAAMAFGPETGLALLDQLMASRPCRTTTCCPACAATSWQLGRHAERGRSSSGGLADPYGGAHLLLDRAAPAPSRPNAGFHRSTPTRSVRPAGWSSRPRDRVPAVGGELN